MTATSIQDRLDELFADARDMYDQAIERLDHGDIRDAAEQAWRATRRATDGLILARAGEEPVTTAGTRAGTTAVSTNSTALASTTVGATPTPSAASEKPVSTSATPKFWLSGNAAPRYGKIRP